MKAIQLKNVYKKFDGASYPALNHLSLDVDEGEFVTILGTSGCGKTTLIKSINRLIEIDSGEINVNGQNIQDADAVQLRRSIGYVIQQIGLFPHMTIGDNIATVPKILKWDKDKINQRTDELMKMIDLDPQEFKNRYPSELSGGQQQRVGLVRALAAKPAIMLLDEPFGAIDAITRDKLQDELIRIHQKNKGTFMFVTHDINEAFKLGTKVLIMDHGELQQYDTPERIREHPANEFVLSLITKGHPELSYGDVYD